MEPGNLATSARKLEEWKYGTLKLANMEPETLVLCDTITVGGKRSILKTFQTQTCGVKRNCHLKIAHYCANQSFIIPYIGMQ